jgi:hypothetical protein
MNTTVWALEQNKFDESDYSWCKGLGVEIKVDPLYSNVYSHTQLVSQVCNGLRIRLTTTCEKQESMLKLKYGNRLIEVQRSINLSHDESQRLNF